MAKEINLVFLFKILKAAWWKILIFTVVIAIAAGAVTEFVIPKKYSSTTEFYVLNTSTTSEYTTTSLLSAAEYLANDYVEIILGDEMIAAIIDDLTAKGVTNCTYNGIRNMISSSTAADSSTFKITTTSTDKELAFYVSDSIKKNAPDIIKKFTRPSYSSSLYRKTTKVDDAGKEVDSYVQISEEDLECIKVIRSPELAKAPVSPSVPKNTLVAAVLAAVLAYVFFLVRKLFDTTIRTEDNAKELVNKTVIGDIPTWNDTESDKKEDRK